MSDKPKSAKGRSITDEQLAAFRAAFLQTGIPSRAATQVGISKTYGLELAKRLMEDEEFLKEREQIRALFLPIMESMMQDTFQRIIKRINRRDPTPEDLARIAVEHGLKSFSYQNPKPQYWRGAVDYFSKVSSALTAKTPAEERSGPAVVIHMTGGEIEIEENDPGAVGGLPAPPGADKPN